MVDKLKLVLSVDDVNVVLEALGNQPFVKVNDVINAIRVQAIDQMQPAQEAELEKAAGVVND